MKNTELLIPTWPNHQTSSDKIGAADFGNCEFDHDSIWVNLRAKPTNDAYEGAYQFRAWQDIGMYLWISARYTMCLEFKAHEVHSADESELKTLCKNIKWVNTRLKDLGEITIENLPERLSWVCSRLGIRRTIKYQRGVYKDEFGPVQDAIDLIVSEVHRRLNRMPGKRAA